MDRAEDLTSRLREQVDAAQQNGGELASSYGCRRPDAASNADVAAREAVGTAIADTLQALSCDEQAMDVVSFAVFHSLRALSQASPRRAPTVARRCSL